jgi:hypothetical protein
VIKAEVIKAEMIKAEVIKAEVLKPCHTQLRNLKVSSPREKRLIEK